jgi:hypothetical protein
MYDYSLGYDPFSPAYGADPAAAGAALAPPPPHAPPAVHAAHHAAMARHYGGQAGGNFAAAAHGAAAAMAPAHPHGGGYASPLANHAAFAAQRTQPVQQRQALPLNSAGNVVANQSATVSVLPQRTFQCERFVWGSTSSGFFTIQNLLFGQDSMLVSPGSLDAEIFSQTGMDMSLYGYIAVAGILVTMQVTNISGADRKANAAVVGGTIV